MHVVEILGSGCPKCQYVEKVVREVVDELGVDADIRHVTDPVEIGRSGILSTPGLVVDGRIVLAGRVPTRDQVAGWLKP